MRVTDLYHQSLEKKGYASDAAQEAAIARLQLAQDAWESFPPKSSGFFAKLRSQNNPPPKGVYFWGGVGRG